MKIDIKDKNNKDISFGNIILYDNELYTVIYDNRNDEIALCNNNDESIIIFIKSINTNNIEIVSNNR